MLLVQFSKNNFIMSIILKRKLSPPLPSPPKPFIQKTHLKKNQHAKKF